MIEETDTDGSGTVDYEGLHYRVTTTILHITYLPTTASTLYKYFNINLQTFSQRLFVMK